jgi:hypothetical protein
MQTQFTAPITYFLTEGQQNLDECMKIAFTAALKHKVNKIIIFTAEGRGIKLALQDFLRREEYEGIKLIGVRFPAGKHFTDGKGNQRLVEFSPEDQALFADSRVPIIRANLPFDTIAPHYGTEGRLGQDFGFVSNALNIFGGSMSLCVQSTMLACDAGEVDEGEHVIAMTSDTAILSRAATTSRFLTDFIVREIFCKPAVLTIIKNEEPNSQQRNLPLSIKDESETEGLSLPPGREIEAV